MTDLIKLASEAGFSRAVMFDPAILKPLPEVRDMCREFYKEPYRRFYGYIRSCGSPGGDAELKVLLLIIKTAGSTHPREPVRQFCSVPKIIPLLSLLFR